MTAAVAGTTTHSGLRQLSAEGHVEKNLEAITTNVVLVTGIDEYPEVLHIRNQTGFGYV